MASRLGAGRTIGAGQTVMKGAVSESTDYAAFKKCVLRRTGIDLSLYKHQQMHRRLLSMVERAHARDFMEYYAILQRDAQEFDAFLDRLTINVSELFRNPDRWHELRHRLLPALLNARPRLKVWSAGCSYGAEPYSLAITLAQVDPARTHTVRATDLDKTVLSRAREGVFSGQDVRNVDADSLSVYFDRQAPGTGVQAESAPSFRVRPEIKSRVEFSSHNLLADEFGTGYDLICCRNVIIYFTDSAKERLFRRFYNALAPGGILFLGSTERIFHFREFGFENPSPFYYLRPA